MRGMPVVRTFTPPWAILQHVDWEGPGLIAEALAERGVGFTIHRLGQGEPAPAPDSLGGLVVMGGSMGVYQADQFPFLKQELKLIASAVAAGHPVLGVCLGAQLLAASLGVAVAPGPVFEVGEGWV